MAWDTRPTLSESQKDVRMMTNDLIQEVLLQADNEPAWAPTTDASVRGDDSDDEE